MAKRRTTAVLLWVRADRWTAWAEGEVIAEVEVASARGWEPGVGQRLFDMMALRPGTPVVVALESDLCLPFAFTMASRRQARSRDSVAYQIEEPLPVAAEEVVADYVAQGVRVFGVAADRQLIEGLLGELRDAGSGVVCAAPGATLAASQLTFEHNATDRGWWVRCGAIEQIESSREGPSHWRTLPRDAESLDAVITTQRLAGVEFEAQTLIASELADCPPGFETAQFIEAGQEDPLIEYAARAAERLARGETSATLDLVRGLPADSVAMRDPYRRDRLAVAIALLCAVLAGAAWRGVAAMASERELQRLEDAEAEVFAAAFPDSRIPRGVRTRLQSEFMSLAGARADLSDLPEHADTAVRLESVLASLPDDLRFRVLEIRIESGRVFLLGEARSYSDADRIAASLRRTGLVVAPPSSRQLSEKGVEFRLTAEEPTATPEKNGVRR